MFPDLTIRAYPWIVAAAALVGAMVCTIVAARSGLPVRRVLLAQLGLATAGLLGGRLHQLLELPGGWAWGDVLRPGYRHPGALLGVFLAVPIVRRLLLTRVSLGALADCVAPAIAFALVVLRVGCLGIGCCFGTPSTLPWAVRFPPGSLASTIHARLGWIPSPDLPSLAVHPLQLYFLVLSLAVGVFLLWFGPRKAYDGQVLLVFLAVHESGKFLLEALRQDVTSHGGSATVPALSLLFAVAALATLAVNALRQAGSAGGGDPRHRAGGEQPVQRQTVADRAALGGEIR